MDLSTAVEYDRLYPITLKGFDGKDLGITVNVVSRDSRRVIDSLRKAQDEYWVALKEKSENPSLPEPVLPDHVRLTLIHCIDSWDWGEHSWAHISGSGAASLADREYIIDHPNAKWFKDQIAAGTANIENFSKPSQKSARSGSKKT